eukprot:TRINITY_DN5090_c0_g1_i1.p1 TRINITY_DN5090_c0_g1~~TRINITY_DN5090_c0_g1_i1.p1  ORF type:complete len:737 (+),score=135.33 TRINITY_DN5090_c0_g1_i1:1320-3530(+)
MDDLHHRLAQEKLNTEREVGVLADYDIICGLLLDVLQRSLRDLDTEVQQDNQIVSRLESAEGEARVKADTLNRFKQEELSFIDETVHDEMLHDSLAGVSLSAKSSPRSSRSDRTELEMQRLMQATREQVERLHEKAYYSSAVLRALDNIDGLYYENLIVSGAQIVLRDQRLDCLSAQVAIVINAYDELWRILFSAGLVPSAPSAASLKAPPTQSESAEKYTPDEARAPSPTPVVTQEALRAAGASPKGRYVAERDGDRRSTSSASSSYIESPDVPRASIVLPARSAGLAQTDAARVQNSRPPLPPSSIIPVPASAPQQMVVAPSALSARPPSPLLKPATPAAQRTNLSLEERARNMAQSLRSADSDSNSGTPPPATQPGDDLLVNPLSLKKILASPTPSPPPVVAAPREKRSRGVASSIDSRNWKLTVSGATIEGRTLVVHGGPLDEFASQSVIVWEMRSSEDQPWTEVQADTTNPTALPLKLSQVGKYIRVRVEYGGEEMAVNLATPIAPGFPRIKSLNVVGGPYVSNALTIHPEYEGGVEGASRVQWFNKELGGRWAPIPLATTKSYQPTVDDMARNLCVDYTPVRSDNVVGETVRCIVPVEFLKIDPEVARQVEHNKSTGSAQWDLTYLNGPREEQRILHIDNRRLRLRSQNSTKYKIPTTTPVLLLLHPEDPTIFSIEMDPANCFDFKAQNARTRDIIVLTLRSFFYPQLQKAAGVTVMSLDSVQKTVSLDP